MSKKETKKAVKKKVVKKNKGSATVTKEKKEVVNWFKRKEIIIPIALLFLVVIAAGVYLYVGGSGEEDSGPDMTIVKDIGAVKIRGDGLPGYDIDRDGSADYLSSGFGYYKELHDAGGFEYGPGIVELEEFDLNITLPQMSFKPDDIVESSVGSVVSFRAEDQDSKITVTIIYKTLGPAMNTYNVIVKYSDGETYRFIDSIAEDGAGEIVEKEVEIAGHHMFRE